MVGGFWCPWLSSMWGFGPRPSPSWGPAGPGVSTRGCPVREGQGRGGEASLPGPTVMGRFGSGAN